MIIPLILSYYYLTIVYYCAIVTHYNVGPPSDVGWFWSPMNTIIISIINHVEWYWMEVCSPFFTNLAINQLNIPLNPHFCWYEVTSKSYGVLMIKKHQAQGPWSMTAEGWRGSGRPNHFFCAFANIWIYKVIKFMVIERLYYWLVVEPTPLKIWLRQLGWIFPIYGKIKSVPHHQPGTIYGSSYFMMAY